MAGNGITEEPTQTKYSEQNILNKSYDTDFNVLAFENLTHNPITNSLERVSAIQGNASLGLAYDGSNQLTTISKVIGGTTYQKTLTWVGGYVTAVSAWS